MKSEMAMKGVIGKVCIHIKSTYRIHIHYQHDFCACFLYLGMFLQTFIHLLGQEGRRGTF